MIDLRAFAEAFLGLYLSMAAACLVFFVALSYRLYRKSPVIYCLSILVMSIGWIFFLGKTTLIPPRRR